MKQSHIVDFHMPQLKHASRLDVIKLFSCSTQLSTKFQLLIKAKLPTNEKKFLALSLSDVVFIMLMNVKMPKLLAFKHL